MILRGMFGTRGDPDRVIRNAFAAGEDGIWVAPRLGGMFQDAALTTPWTADGQPVGGYVDRSPNGYVGAQATSAARPFGYSNRLVGDGVDDWINFGDVLDLRLGSYFAVCAAKFNSTSGGQTIFSKAATGSTQGRYALRLNSGSLQSYVHLADGLHSASFPDANTSLRVIAVTAVRGGMMKLRINGVLKDQQSAGPAGYDADTTLNYALFAQDGVFQPMAGEIREVVQVMRAPAVGELEAIEQRLIVAHAVETGGGG